MLRLESKSNRAKFEPPLEFKVRMIILFPNLLKIGWETQIILLVVIYPYPLMPI